MVLSARSAPRPPLHLGESELFFAFVHRALRPIEGMWLRLAWCPWWRGRKRRDILFLIGIELVVLHANTDGTNRHRLRTSTSRAFWALVLRLEDLWGLGGRPGSVRAAFGVRGRINIDEAV